MRITFSRFLRFHLSLLFTCSCIAGATLALPVLVGAEQGKELNALPLKNLEGRWLRPDGGYDLELTEIQKDGTLKAAYYNPRSINVSKAQLSESAGTITLFVELRDVNYPGSAYNLVYDPSTDRLRGTYFQAVEKQTYPVEFVRITYKENQ